MWRMLSGRGRVVSTTWRSSCGRRSIWCRLCCTGSRLPWTVLYVFSLICYLISICVRKTEAHLVRFRTRCASVLCRYRDWIKSTPSPLGKHRHEMCKSYKDFLWHLFAGQTLTGHCFTVLVEKTKIRTHENDSSVHHVKIGKRILDSDPSLENLISRDQSGLHLVISHGSSGDQSCLRWSDTYQQTTMTDSSFVDRTGKCNQGVNEPMIVNKHASLY